MATTFELRVCGNNDTVILGSADSVAGLMPIIKNAFDNLNGNMDNLYVKKQWIDEYGKKDSQAMSLNTFLIPHIIDLQAQIDEIKKKLG